MKIQIEIEDVRDEKLEQVNSFTDGFLKQLKIIGVKVLSYTKFGEEKE